MGSLTAIMMAGLLMLCVAGVVGLISSYKALRRECMALQDELREGMAAEAEEALSPLSLSGLVANARRLKVSRNPIKRLSALVGRDLSPYFTPARNADRGLEERLRRIGVHPDEIDLPPPVAGLEEEILAPPQEADARNEGFFARRNQAG